MNQIKLRLNFDPIRFECNRNLITKTHYLNQIKQYFSFILNVSTDEGF